MLRAVVFLALLLIATTAYGQEGGGDFKHSLRLDYQFVETGEIDSSVGAFDIGVTTTHVLRLSVDYALSDRWTVFGSVPYIRKRHRGAGAHNPLIDFVNYTPPDLRLSDDGEYHGGFQDVTVGVRYRTQRGPLTISPYLAIGSPVSNYPTYGNAVIGKQLWEAPLGVALEYTPYFSDWYFYADVAYVFAEKAQDVNLNYWLWSTSVGYYVTPKFAPRIFLTQRYAPNALKWPEDFPADLDNEIWFEHDRIITHGYLDGGIGFDFIVNRRLSVSATYYQTIDPDQVAEVDTGITLAVTRRF